MSHKRTRVDVLVLFFISTININVKKINFKKHKEKTNFEMRKIEILFFRRRFYSFFFCFKLGIAFIFIYHIKKTVF